MKLKFKINKKLTEAYRKVATISKKLLNIAFAYATALTLILMFVFGALKLPEAHNLYLRQTVGSKVYMIRDSKMSGGGTGFAVQAPSGETYILTNDHVCGVSKDGDSVLVSNTDENISMRRRIIAHDENSDLCLIEGVPGIKGLEVADSAPFKGETLKVIGHPRLMPLHLSAGELTGTETVVILVGPISMVNPETGKEEQIDPKMGGVLPEQCMMAKNRQVTEELDLMFFVLKIKFCLVEVKDAYVTSVVVKPGNSGSPVVNFWGNVEGVVFASDSTSWGRMISINDVKAFLKNY